MFLKIELNCDKENHVDFRHSCSFQKMCNLTCVLIYSLTKYVLENGFEDSFVIFAEKYP